jgi:hypothetical protein
MYPSASPASSGQVNGNHMQMQRAEKIVRFAREHIPLEAIEAIFTMSADVHNTVGEYLVETGWASDEQRNAMTRYVVEQHPPYMYIIGSEERADRTQECIAMLDGAGIPSEVRRLCRRLIEEEIFDCVNNLKTLLITLPRITESPSVPYPASGQSSGTEPQSRRA